MPPKKRKTQSKHASTKASATHNRKSRSKYGIQKGEKEDFITGKVY